MGEAWQASLSLCINKERQQFNCRLILLHVSPFDQPQNHLQMMQAYT